MLVLLEKYGERSSDHNRGQSICHEVNEKQKRIAVVGDAYARFILYTRTRYIYVVLNLPSKANRMSDIGTIYRVDTCLLQRRASPPWSASLLTAIKIHFRG